MICRFQPASRQSEPGHASFKLLQPCFPRRQIIGRRRDVRRQSRLEITANFLQASWHLTRPLADCDEFHWFEEN
jgi:hypothetical protein